MKNSRQHSADILIFHFTVKRTAFFFLLLLRNNNPDLVCGQGTMGLEIVDQLEGVDAIIVPVGGGTLLAGTCVAVKILYPSIKIIVCTVFYTSYPETLYRIAYL